MEKVDQFLDGASSQEEVALTYHASEMVLTVHSNASHLSEPKARIRYGGHFSCHLIVTTRLTMEPC